MWCSEPEAVELQTRRMHSGGRGAMTGRSRELSNEHKAYGYRRITALPRREGSKVNVKRVCRFWMAVGLQQPLCRAGKRRCRPMGEVVRKAERPNHVRVQPASLGLTDLGQAQFNN